MWEAKKAMPSVLLLIIVTGLRVNPTDSRSAGVDGPARRFWMNKYPTGSGEGLF